LSHKILLVVASERLVAVSTWADNPGVFGVADEASRESMPRERAEM
jgi:hypothetical protein